MKTKKLIFLFSILFSMLATNASAKDCYDFAVKNADGVMIYYKYYNSNIRAFVTYKTESYNSYSGSVVIPTEITYEGRTLKVTGIGKGAFRGCTKLTSITIPNSVTDIRQEAFYECSNLKSISIPNSVTSIGAWAFSGCTSLTSVKIPNSVTSLEGRTFEYCSNLTSVTLPNKIEDIGSMTFYQCSSLKSITIPNSVKTIHAWAFRFCTSLTSVTIPSSVTSIGEDAFGDCKSLKSVTIPNSVTSIGESAFIGCSKLQKVTSKITKPFAINDNTFPSYTYSKGTLYVPKGTVAKYKATDGWKNFFKNIVEEGTKTAIDDVEADNKLNTSNIIYDINGKRLPATSLDELPSGLYIINGKKIAK